MSSRTLVFVIHGLRGNSRKLKDLKCLLQEAYPGCDPQIPDFGYKSLFSTARATSFVQEIISLIDTAYNDGDFDRVVLVGHSMGAVLARRVLIEASGVPNSWNADTPKFFKVESELTEIWPRQWANKVQRLVMFASISRGWSAEHTKSPIQSFQWKLGGLIGHLLPRGLRPTLFDFRLGSPFIVQTRLRWLDYCSHVQNRPQVIQFLGTQDDVAPPNDTVDFATTKDEQNFMQVELPHSGHSNLLQFYPKFQDGDIQSQQIDARSRIVKAVLQNNYPSFKDFLVKREWFLDELPAQPDPLVEHVVFVMHGIRDRGFWTKKVASRIKEKAEADDIRLVSRTPSYGYFPILPFILPWYRQQKVEWFMDHYVEAAAVYPNANMHFLGHSNGTYLAARALKDYPIASFKRIFFAGSVVWQNYNWHDPVSAGRVKKVFNIVATGDWVIAIFPYGLSPLHRVFDLGGAGHIGFQEPLPDAVYQMDYPNQDSNERDYVHGGHRAGREEVLWNEIANFFVNEDDIPAGTSKHFKPKQPLFWRIIGELSSLIVACITVAVLGLGMVSIWATLSSMTTIAPPVWANDNSIWEKWFSFSTPAQLLLLCLYFIAIRFMALRF